MIKKLSYNLPHSLGRLVIMPTVLNVFHTHRQIRIFKKEAGGQLFGVFDTDLLTITEASRPVKADVRSRFSFILNLPNARKEIRKQFKQNGYHFIGDWHTHPEDVPLPSSTDLKSIKTFYDKNVHELNGVLLIIVGRNEFPEGLFVAYQMSDKLHILEPDFGSDIIEQS